MEIDDNAKRVILWKTSDEDITDLPADIRAELMNYRKKKYLIAYMISGREDLSVSTLSLLKTNKERLARTELWK